MKRGRRIDVNLDELDRIIDRSTRAPLPLGGGILAIRRPS
jgi:hypothetical protein